MRLPGDAAVWMMLPEAMRAHGLATANVLAGALAAAVWEGVVLVAAVALALRLVPGLSSALRARLWLAVLAVLVALPAVPVFMPIGVSHVMAQRAGVAGIRPLQVSAMWSLWVVSAWAVLSVARAGKLAAGALRLRRIAREAMPVEAGDNIATLLEHGGRVVELCLSAEVGRPSVVGFFKPRILLQPTLFAALSPDELRQVLLHEMEHLRRRDDWTNLLQKLALVVLPLHPALFWVERRLCEERELACDDGVLRATAARKAYAACLVALAEHAMLQRGAALALGAWERRTELARRVCRILQRPEPALRPRMARMAAGGVLGGVLAGGVLLAGIPQPLRFVSEPMQQHTIAARLPLDGIGAGGDMLVDPRSSLGTGAGGRVTAQPVIARMPDGRAAAMPHVTLASALLPVRPRTSGLRRRPLLEARGGSSAGSLRTGSGLPRAGSNARRVSAVAGRRGSVREVSYQRPLYSPRLVLLTSWPSAAPVLTLSVDTSDDKFSPSYAAVPMQGGWLLVQL